MSLSHLAVPALLYIAYNGGLGAPTAKSIATTAAKDAKVVSEAAKKGAGKAKKGLQKVKRSKFAQRFTAYRKNVFRGARKAWRSFFGFGNALSL